MRKVATSDPEDKPNQNVNGSSIEDGEPLRELEEG
jgi:hypothetical protein